MKRVLAVLVLFSMMFSAPASPVLRADDLELTIDGRAFKVNGTARFLVFVSYFDAFDVSNGNLESDFYELKSRGVDGVRIFPNWWRQATSSPPRYYAQDTLIDPDGNLRSGTLDKLLDILDIAKGEGLLVDLSFSGESVGDCPTDDCLAFNPNIGSLTESELSDALVDLTDILAEGGSAYKHVFYDLQNEVNLNQLSDGYLDATDLDEIAEAIHAVDPNRIVTASISGDDEPADAADFADAAELDVATWHEKRDSEWWLSTYLWVGAMRTSTSKPVYLQEPEPRGDADWTQEGVSANVQAAKEYGAAAWCFHTRSGFALNGTSLWSSLHPEESGFLDDLASLLGGVGWGI